MQFKVEIENLGKIKKAEVDIKPLTILVGKNSTGKSFITKSLYCILNTLNKNHIALEIQKLTDGIGEYFSYFYSLLPKEQKYDLENLLFLNKEYIPFLNKIVDKTKDKNIVFTERIISENREEFIKINEKLERYMERKTRLKNMSKESKKILQIIKNKLNKLKNIFLRTRMVLVNKISEHINTYFKKNFQQKDIGWLVRFGNEKSIVSLANIGSIEIDTNEKITFNFLKEGIEEIGNLKNVVYLDSPVYLKLKKGLTRIKEPILFIKEESLKGYPLYIDDLFNFLDLELIEENEIEFQKISKYIQGIVRGKFQKNEIGEFEFVEENKYKIPLSLLAMGTSNIALIEYLIRNNIISKGSFLIIDEPESHLHPQWQVELTGILYKIAQNGANVIIATHSIDIVKAMEVMIREDKKAKDLIAINKMPYSPEFQEKSIIEKIEDCLNELMEPYSNLVWRSL